MTHAPRHQRELINLSRPGVRLFGEVSTPTDEQSLSFDVPLRLLKTASASAVDRGDVLFFEGVRYLLGYYTQSAYMRHFRMFPLPLQVSHTRMVVSKDLVTGLPRAQERVALPATWCHQLATGETADATSKVQVYRVIAGTPLQVGDLVDGRKVLRLRNELGIQIAETA